jgi:DNA-binding NarL/FixJ family response regulator
MVVNFGFKYLYNSETTLTLKQSYMSKINILIADDHKLIRETWSYILNSDSRFQVVGECGDAQEAVELAKTKRPHVVLMDINMTPFSGLEATQRIRKISPGSKVIGVSMHSQPAYAKKMLQMGARGYVTKNSSKEEMIKAILEVNHGNKYICDEIKNIISEQLLDEKEDSPNINALTEREMQIINFIKEGLSSKEIATSLNISLKTVEVHRHNILKKLKLKNSASLVNFINTNATYI